MPVRKIELDSGKYDFFLTDDGRMWIDRYKKAWIPERELAGNNWAMAMAFKIGDLEDTLASVRECLRIEQAKNKK